MKRQTARFYLFAALAIAALTLYAYRNLPPRLFIADDYQWLVAVRDLSFGDLVRTAFDPTSQSHFYRPLVWLLFWLQFQLFGNAPAGYHAVSLGLHLLNATLLAALAFRLQPAGHRLQRAAWLAFALAALHPAVFEAVAWVSAQSDLLAAALLLAMLHAWLAVIDQRPFGRLRAGSTTNDHTDAKPCVSDDRTDAKPCVSATNEDGGRRTEDGQLLRTVNRQSSIVIATIFLGLALLTKESAVIGLPLLALLTLALHNDQRPMTNDHSASSGQAQRLQAPQRAICITLHSQLFTLNLLLPTLLTLAYLWLQFGIIGRNYLTQSGGYGFGPQLLLNPLRMLGLLAAPLPGSEAGDAWWLPWVGASLLVLLLAWALRGPRRWPRLALVAALLLTTLPTAPFASPPDSRYLYLPLLAFALLVGLMNERRTTNDERRTTKTRWWSLVSGHWSVMLALCLAAVLMLDAREAQFAAAGGPGGSLWRLASQACAGPRLNRMLIVEPPLAAVHAEAIVTLACGDRPRPLVVSRAQIAQELRANSLVVSFSGGQARIEQRS